MIRDPFEDKNFLVTGAACGLGAAFVEGLLEERDKNVAVLDIDEKVGKEFVEKLNKKYGNKAIFVKCNVANEKEIDNAFKEVLRKFNTIDAIVNNAGIMNDSENLWRIASDVNWQGVVSFTLKGIKHMRKDEGGYGGTIINVSCMSGFARVSMYDYMHVSSILPIYCGSKSAVLHFSQSLADPHFHSITGIRVQTLCLGPTNTALLQSLEERAINKQVVKEQVLKKIRCAVATLTTMYREGANRSVWLTIDDKPPQDITPTIELVYKEFEELLTMETA